MGKRAARKRRSRLTSQMREPAPPSVMLDLLNGTSMMLIGNLLFAARRKLGASEERAMFLNAVYVLRSLKSHRREVLQHCVLAFDVAKELHTSRNTYDESQFKAAAEQLTKLIAEHWRVRVEPMFLLPSKPLPERAEDIELGFDPDDLPRVELVPLTEEMSTEDVEVETDSMTGEEYEVRGAAEQNIDSDLVEPEETEEPEPELEPESEPEPEPESEGDGFLRFVGRQKRGAYDLVDD